ncbi:MAG: TIGR02453 family protein [Cyanobacteria bacterium P01_F01_bin.53]
MSAKKNTRQKTSQTKAKTIPINPTFEGFTAAGFDFLSALENNNQREWFQENKKRYHQSVRDPFVDFIEALSYRLEGSDLDLQGSKQSVFRIHRDTRFSKDKTPYKAHAGGVLSYSGTKKDQRGILYIQFASDGGFMTAGFYQPESKVLGAIREAIAQNQKQSLSITQALSAKKLPLQATASLKRMPRGFEAHQDAEVANLLKMKGHIMRQDISPEQWKRPDIVETVAQFAHDTHPWIAFGRDAIAQMNG